MSSLNRTDHDKVLARRSIDFKFKLKRKQFDAVHAGTRLLSQEGDRRSPKPAVAEQASSEKKLLGPYLRRIKKERKQNNREIYLTNN